MRTCDKWIDRLSLLLKHCSDGQASMIKDFVRLVNTHTHDPMGTRAVAQRDFAKLNLYFKTISNRKFVCLFPDLSDLVVVAHFDENSVLRYGFLVNKSVSPLSEWIERTIVPWPVSLFVICNFSFPFQISISLQTHSGRQVYKLENFKVVWLTEYSFILTLCVCVWAIGLAVMMRIVTLHRVEWHSSVESTRC